MKIRAYRHTCHTHIQQSTSIGINANQISAAAIVAIMYIYTGYLYLSHVISSTSTLNSNDDMFLSLKSRPCPTRAARCQVIQVRCHDLVQVGPGPRHLKRHHVLEATLCDLCVSSSMYGMFTPHLGHVNLKLLTCWYGCSFIH